MTEYTVDEIKNKISLDAQEAIKQIEKIINLTGKLGDNVEKTGKKGLGGFLGALKLGAVVYAGKQIAKMLKGMTLEAFNYIETLNLFEVSMGKNVAGMEQYYDRAVKFQNQLAEAFGANTAETMKYQAFFNQMSKSMGIANEQAYLLSENFTKLGMDISSLFNIEQGDAMAKLRAGLAGQTKPLRDIGLDITQQSLQPILSELGIDKAVKQMSQAEKMILRYIAVIRQASASHGDFAKTIESPMNQIRVFQNQIAIFKRNVGSLFSGMFASIMPYVNGILMAINAIVKAIATIFGITLSSANTGGLSAGIGADDLAGDLDNASGSAKQLKKTLMGFDEINNIAEPTSGGSGGGTSGAGGGVDPRLLEAMKEYDNLMGNVEMKANKIRDAIMKWLGFTKIINPLTGEVFFKLAEGFKSLNGWVKLAIGLVGTLFGAVIIRKVVGFIGTLARVSSAWKGVILQGTAFQIGIATVGKAVSTASLTFRAFRAEGFSMVASLSGATKAFLAVLPAIIPLIVGISGLIGGSVLAYKATNELSNGLIGVGEAATKTAIGIGGATAAGALIGSVFPGVGTAIGAVAGAIIGVGVATLGYETDVDKLNKKIKENTDIIGNNAYRIQEQKKIVEDYLNTENSQFDHYGKLNNELKTLVDSNGKVKEGYEARVKYILTELNNGLSTEYELTGDVITQNGKQVDSMEEVNKSIRDQIELMKTQSMLKANESIYNTAIKEQATLAATATEATKNRIKAEELLAEATTGMTLIEQVERGKRTKALEQAIEAEKKATKEMETNTQIIIKNDNLRTALQEGNVEKIKKAQQELSKMYKTEAGVQQLTLDGQATAYSNYYKEQIKSLKDQGIKVTEEMKKQYSWQIEELTLELIKQSTTVKKITPEIENAWRILGENNYTSYKEGLEKLEPEVQTALQKMTGVFVTDSPNVTNAAKKLSNDIIKALETDDKSKKEALKTLNEYLKGLNDKEIRTLLQNSGVKITDEIVEKMKKRKCFRRSWNTNIKRIKFWIKK